MTGSILGLDLGTACGWAVLNANGDRRASGTWNLAPRRFEGAGMRWVRLGTLLGELLDANPGAVLAVEEVRHHAGTDAAHLYGGALAVVQRVCEERQVPYAGIPVATVKRVATGKGNADKAAMVAAALHRWGAVADDNDADALWIAETWRQGVPQAPQKPARPRGKAGHRQSPAAAA